MINFMQVCKIKFLKFRGKKVGQHSKIGKNYKRIKKLIY